MQPPFPAFTGTWHNDTYASIDPTKSELSASGKTVVIFGAGQGSLGRDIAVAFARSGAKHIALIGRTTSRLEATKSAITTNSSVTIHPADVRDEGSLKQSLASLTSWDVLVLAMGDSVPGVPLAKSNSSDWWANYELAVHGTFNVLHTLLPTANPTGAVLLNMFSDASCFPNTSLGGLSGYIPAKVAQSKIVEIVGCENASLRAVNIHPGMIDTEGFKKGGHDASKLPMDKPELSAHFAVWASSSEGAFLDGKTVFANWDVDEMKAKQASLNGSQTLTNGVLGWPFA